MSQLNNNDLISELKKTDEYKRSDAIAGAIHFLVEQINLIKDENKKLLNTISQKEEYTSTLSEQLTHLKSQNALLQNEAKLYKTKHSVLEQLNSTLEQTISELNSKMTSQQNAFNSKCSKFSSIMEEYKQIFEGMKSEKISLEKKLQHTQNELNDIKELCDRISKENNSMKAEQRKWEMINKKMKDYEILMYKMDLENQTFQQEIKNYQKKVMEIDKERRGIGNMQPLTIKKIDLNSELNTIEEDYNEQVIGTAVNLCTETEANNAIGEEQGDHGNEHGLDEREMNSDEEDLNSLTQKIRQTEKTIKEVSALLLQKENNNAEASSQEFKNIMNMMENQTEKLISLKKKYNQMIKP